jgi:hypothetical protein
MLNLTFHAQRILKQQLDTMTWLKVLTAVTTPAQSSKPRLPIVQQDDLVLLHSHLAALRIANCTHQGKQQVYLQQMLTSAHNKQFKSLIATKQAR